MYTDAATGRSEESKESKYDPELITTQAEKVIAQSMMERVQCTPRVTRYLAGLPRKPYHIGGPALLAAASKVGLHQ